MSNLYQLRPSFPPSRLAALLAVDAERDRQDVQWPAPDGFNDALALAILVEEVGEVAQAQLMAAIDGGDTDHLREELVQVAAVAVRWLEHLDEQA